MYTGENSQDTDSANATGGYGRASFAFDNSGFTVATGGSKASASRNDPLNIWVMIGGGALLLVWLLTRK